MIEENAIAGIHSIGLSIVHRNPVGVELGDGVWAPRVERGGFHLWGFLHQAVQFAGAGLVEACFLFEAEDADGFEDAQGADGVDVGSVFGAFEADCDVALRAKVVDLVGFRFLDDAHQIAGVAQVAVMQV